MTDASNDAAGQTARSERLLVRRRGVLLGTAVAVVIGVIAMWFVFALARSGPESIGHSGSTTSTAVDPTARQGSAVLSERRYSDEELGIDKLIDEEIMPFDARYRNFSDWETPYDERQRYLEEDAIGHERERLYFERNMEWLLSSEYERLPADLGHEGILDRAFEEAMDECAGAAGWPGLKISVNSRSDVDHALDVSGLTYEEFLDLRHECAKQAASYPTLEPAVRDELLDRLREHYRAAVHEYLRTFPDAEVPLIDHPGVGRPLEERLIKTCLKDPDPASCAERYRVELPAE